MASIEIIPEVSGFEFDEDSDYDRAKEVEEFDETKAGVKGLVDFGVVKIPKFFICPKESLQNFKETNNACQQVPVIDLEGSEGSRREEIVNEISRAAEKWGLFQVVHHGVPVPLLDDMLEGIRLFHEQPKEVKAQLYSRDVNQLIRYLCNATLLTSKEATNWRDTLAFDFHNSQINKETIPQVCMQYSFRMMLEASKFYIRITGLIFHF